MDYQPNAVEQPTLFDYAELDTETRIVVQQRTQEIRGLMKRSAQDIIDIGQKLIEVKARLPHGQFGPWLQGEFEWTTRTAQSFMNVGEQFSKYENFSHLNFAPSALYLLAAPSTPDEAREEAIALAVQGQAVTHAKAKALVEDAKGSRALPASPVKPVEPAYRELMPEPSPIDSSPPMPTPATSQAVVTVDVPIKEESPPAMPSKMAIHYSSDTPEHYTPQELLGAVVDCMGGIDLDPCSNSHDDPNVSAREYYTKEDDGLLQDWNGRVYMNPPYGREIGAWVDKLLKEYEEGRCTEAIALVPARTDTQWFNALQNFPVCLIVGRLTFIGNSDPAPFPSAVFYLGPHIDRFYYSFSPLGGIWQTIYPGDFGE